MLDELALPRRLRGFGRGRSARARGGSGSRCPTGVIYLDGNSLGPLPRATAAVVAGRRARQWGEDLISSWNKHGWIDLPQRVGAKIARLIGAKPHEVVVADSTSVNLFKLIAAALGLRPGRRVVVSERGNFPTDLYVAQGLRDLLGERLELRLVATEELEAALDHRHRAAHAHPRRLSHRAHARHGAADRGGARRRGARALGSRAQRRRGPGGPRRARASISRSAAATST